MRSNRRRTISYMDLENFLNEVDPEPSAHLNKGSKEKENNHITIPMSTDEGCKTTQKQEVTKLKTDKDHIRDYCKIVFNSHSQERINSQSLDISRNIHKMFNYPLLSNRQMYPESYSYPSQSLEAKKQLLYSLSPVLGDLDKQRKIDSSDCEKYTRCKVNKGAYNTFEYYDFDMNSIVTDHEYEKRYSLYLESQRCNNIQRINMVNFDIQNESQDNQETTISISDVEMDVIVDHDDSSKKLDSASEKEQEHQKFSESNQAILSSFCKELDELLSDVTPMQLSPSIKAVEETTNEYQSSSSCENNGRSGDLSCWDILEDENYDTLDRRRRKSRRNDSYDSRRRSLVLGDPLDLIQQLEEDQPRDNSKAENSEKPLCSVENRRRLSAKAGMKSMINSNECRIRVPDEVKKFSMCRPNLDDLEEYQKRSQAKLAVRFEIIRWKYHWEIASSQAASRAREIFENRCL